MNFKNKIVQNIVSPNIRQIESEKYLAEVTEANENNNLCIIRYKDNRGSNQQNKPAFINIGTCPKNWFPEIGDKIIIEVAGSICNVIGPYTNFQVQREKEKLKESKGPRFNSNIGGNLF